MKIILGSGSPRRKELLEQTGYKFEVLVSEADENIQIDDPVDMVEELSCRKASAVAETLIARNDGEDYLIIGADTIVVMNDQILGKPMDKENAYEMMRELSGKTHQVYTGVTFLIVRSGIIVYKKKIHERTDVDIRKMSEEEIADYIENTDDWKDKAGAYGIQTPFGVKYIPKIKGDYYNVVGLPACAVAQRIEKLLRKKITVADALQAAGQPVRMDCGGAGTCGKCKTKIKMNSKTIEVLACQTTFEKGMKLVIEDKKKEHDRILTESEEFEVNPKNVSEENLLRVGMAVDIGTTTVAAYFYNLSSGARMAVKSAMNRQIIHGADVISRIQYASETNQLIQLRQEIIDTINEMIEELCKEMKEVSPENIRKIVLCGNSAMQHLFFGWSPEKLGKSPYTNVNEELVERTGKKSKLLCHEEAKVTFLPLMGSFVGADTLSCLLTFPDDGKTRLVVDLGTNGEIALGSERHGYLFASTACGPAFEGNGLTCGMRGMDRAIEKVRFERGHVLCQTIGEGTPKGICGSGIVSALSAMREADILTKDGRIRSKREFIMKHPGNLLASKIKEVGPGNLAFYLSKGSHPVYITQHDVRKIQEAKGAIYAGCMTLLEQKGIEIDEVDQMAIAGAFGNYIDVEEAMNIGLLPRVSKDKVKQIGNGAGLGVQQYLFQPELREKAEEIKEKSSHIRLAKLDSFRDLYIENMNF